MIPPDSLCYYPNLDYDYVLTEQQKQSLFPNVQEYDFEYENPTNQQYSHYLKMNWGWDGHYNNGVYIMDYQNGWCSESDTLNLVDGMKIFYNFREQ